jgi:adenylate cyclase
MLNYRRIKKGCFPVDFRIGINSGEMLAGYMGSVQRMQYTVLGDSVNLASRLCTAGERGQILVTEETYSLPQVRDRVVARKFGSMRLKGKAQPVSTYEIMDIAPPYRHILDKQILQIANGGK